MTQRIGLLRGINVGRAKRIAMADLQSLTEGLGFAEARTLLGSGNVLFQASVESTLGIASALCADGILQSPLAQAFSRATGDAVATRNWATVLKLQQAIA